MADLKKLRAGESRRILDDIQRKLSHEPGRPTKHIKQLRNLVPPFETVRPIWQLRTGDYRVFYDVDEAARRIIVRAVRRKPAAVLLGVEGKDWETVVFETSSRFWELIEERRGEPTLSAEELDRKPTTD